MILTVSGACGEEIYAVTLQASSGDNAKVFQAEGLILWGLERDRSDGRQVEDEAGGG